MGIVGFITARWWDRWGLSEKFPLVPTPVWAELPRQFSFPWMFPCQQLDYRGIWVQGTEKGGLGTAIRHLTWGRIANGKGWRIAAVEKAELSGNESDHPGRNVELKRVGV